MDKQIPYFDVAGGHVGAVGPGWAGFMDHKLLITLINGAPITHRAPCVSIWTRNSLDILSTLQVWRSVTNFKF